jgi:hypothetical protein
MGRGSWEPASRDDGEVARDIYETRNIERMYALSEAAFFDELFEYTREIGLWPLLEDLDPGKRRAQLYPFIQFVMCREMERGRARLQAAVFAANHPPSRLESQKGCGSLPSSWISLSFSTG